MNLFLPKRAGGGKEDIGKTDAFLQRAGIRNDSDGKRWVS
ncbi:hypothetical protein B4135_4087 [Caldibacillus debilis]|uniref:Uncharacterized protein n=1 Tax=Caldibacillus debilis TaxID=301148 RepID=A0A150L8R2_9BACI|nr:hypothetical protein B4135_4087 [Caldibacillus debilis]